MLNPHLQICKNEQMRDIWFAAEELLRCLYGVYTAGVRTTDWPSLKNLYCAATSKDTRCSVPAAHLGLLLVGRGIRGSRVLLSRKFHYPIDSDLPPSQFPLFSLSENLFFTFSPLFCFMAAAKISSGWGDYRATADGGKGLILIFQCGREEVGVSHFLSSAAFKIQL